MLDEIDLLRRVMLANGASDVVGQRARSAHRDGHGADLVVSRLLDEAWDVGSAWGHMNRRRGTAYFPGHAWLGDEEQDF